MIVIVPMLRRVGIEERREWVVLWVWVIEIGRESWKICFGRIEIRVH